MDSTTRIGEKPNGCGCASGWLKWIKPPYANLFRDCCIKHDDLYNEGGDNEMRKAADRQLFRAMVCTALFYRPIKTLWLTFIALVYYWSVRLFGKKFFNFH